MSQSRIETFKTMLQDHPDDALIWYGLANEYVSLEQWSQAIEALRHVIRINPDYPAAYQQLGLAHLNLGDVQEARRVWSEGALVAARNGAVNAEHHINRLLADLKTPSPSSFCA